MIPCYGSQGAELTTSPFTQIQKRHLAKVSRSQGTNVPHYPLKKAMDILQEKAGFYIRAELYSAIIREGEEEK